MQRDADGIVIELRYQRGAEQPGARAAELWLQVPDGIRFTGFEDLLANKQVVVQQRGDRLRTVIYSAENLDALSSGALVAWHFAPSGAEPPPGATFSLLDQRPLFAPPPADAALSLPLPLTLRSAP